MEANRLFWGKTFPALDGPRGKSAALYKPVLHHLIDVAAVASSYLRVQRTRLVREAALVAIAPHAYVDLVGFLAGLHDLGKYTRNFQAKVEALWPAILGSWPGADTPWPPHWQATGLLLQLNPLNAAFGNLFPNLRGGETSLIAAIAGHHGRPPPPQDSENEVKHALRQGRWLDHTCVEAARYAFDALKRLTDAQPAVALNSDTAPLLSWRLSGIITLADWVGSDADFFGPAPIDTPPEAYWQIAQLAAKRALEAKGLVPLEGAPDPSLAKIAPRAAASPRPMQRLAEEIRLAEGPQLFIIEDTTGSGKTEAALLIAARMIAAGLGEGLYFALPTMATANAMHERLAAIAAHLFATNPAGRPPSVILSHGKAAVSAALAKLAARPSGDGEETAAASCNGWIADDRRRAFFADIGAGTIDQAFLAILPKKHLTLRQYALAGRILIVDEAHCFDSYMEEELSVLLRLHAMNGGSAIVLSATLARRIRRKIAASFYSGLGRTLKQRQKWAAGCASSAYPLLTHLTRDVVEELPRELDLRLARTVRIERLESRTEGCRAACGAAERGAAVLVICNAVDEAIAVHQDLTVMRPEGMTHLFHARFAQGDRIAIEDEVLARFGRDADLSGRRGNVLVATQVVEQSLDLDFDLVISDLAPVDLLIQRAGRLWRHMDLRPTESRTEAGPKLFVVSPDPSAAVDADWLKACLGRAAFVYKHAGVMWRTARVILARGEFAVPEDLRPMIEAVYGEAAEPVPTGLEAAEMRGEGQQGKDKALAAFNVVDLGPGYGALPSNLRADEEIGTRLGEDMVTIRLARRGNGALVPWFRSGGDARLDWALSELQVRKAFWGSASAPAEDARLHESARRDWTEWECGIALAEVESDGRVRVEGGSFNYSSTSGLRAANRLS